MSQKFRNIEDFIREKLGLLDGDPQPDWAVFERKMSRALWRQRVRRVSGIVSFLALLLFSQTFISGDWSLPEQKNKSENLRSLSPKREAMALPNQHIEEAKMTAQQESPLEFSSAKAVHKENRRSALQVASSGAKQSGSKTPRQEAAQFRAEPFSNIFLQEPDTKEALGKAQGLALGETQMEPKFGFKNTRLRDLLRIQAAAEDKYEPYISPLQEKKPWSYSLNIYPNFAFREFRVDPSKQALLHADFIDAMQNSERSGINLNVGFEISRRVGAITYINSGIEYINNSYRAEFDFVNFRHANFDDRGEIRNYTLRKDPERIAFSDVNSFHFVNIPFSVSYQPWATDHLRINLELGFSVLYFLKAQGSTIDYRTLDLIDLNERSYRRFMASTSLSIGLQYYVSRNMNIGIEPTMMYFSNSIYTEEYPFEVIPYSMGVNFKLQMKLQ